MNRIILCAVFLAACVPVAEAQNPYAVPWFKIAGGGGMQSTGGLTPSTAPSASQTPGAWLAAAIGTGRLLGYRRPAGGLPTVDSAVKTFFRLRRP